MKRIMIITLAALVFAGTTGCSGFLDELPDAGIPQENAVENMADMEKALVAVYAMTKASRGLSGSATLLPEIQCDLVYTPIGSGNSMGNFYKWNFTAQLEEYTTVWTAWWSIIATSNFVLENEAKAYPKTTEDTLRLQNILGEAHLARALGYSEMVKFFCDPYGKQLGGAAADPKSQLGLPVWDQFAVGTPARSNMYDYYQNILTEIQAAKSRITRENTDEDIYFSKAAVRALETRVHIAMGNWEDAIIAASYVIDSCDYALADAKKSTGQTLSDYENMWVNDAGNEIIWKVKFSKDFLGGALGSAFYNSTQGAFRPEFIPATWVLKLYAKEDARYNVFFQEQQMAYAHKLKWPLLKKYPGNPALRKGESSNYVNMPKVFRLSEIYLLRAEAYMESGNEEKAKADLRILWSKRTTRDYSLDNVKQAIRDERVRELYMEGHRMYDLKRWGIGFKRIPQEQTIPPSNALEITNDNVFFTWPIPSHEMDVPGSQIVGNPSNNR